MTAPVAPVAAPAPAPAPEQQTTIPAGPPVSGGPAGGGREADDMAMMMDAQYSVVQEPEGASEAGAAEAPAAPAAAAPGQAAQAPPAPTVPGG